MPEHEWIKLAAAYRRSNGQMVTDIRTIWAFGSTNPHLVEIEFCAADFCVEVL